MRPILTTQINPATNDLNDITGDKEATINPNK
jgi:hypothetical protein